MSVEGGGGFVKVEVAYARGDVQVIVALEVTAGVTVEAAIAQSGILQDFSEINLAVNKMGIFGKLTKPTQVLRPGDRVEIYRALQADPKEARKQRAIKEKKAQKERRGENL